MPNLDVFRTLYLWGGYKLLRLGTDAIHAVPDNRVYLRVYPAWSTLSWLYAVYTMWPECDQDIPGCIWTYLDVSGHTWTYLDVSGHIWTYRCVSKLRYCFLFICSDKTYLVISGHTWTYLDVSGHIWRCMEYKYAVHAVVKNRGQRLYPD